LKAPGPITDDGFLSLVSSRRGHFRLESGHHGRLWMDLDGLFADPARVRPLVERLADAIRPHDVDVVCGPLVGGAFLAQMLAPILRVEFSFTERIAPADGEGLYRVRYVLPRALRDRVRGRRVAIVDDVMSAGSAVRGTHAELQSHGAVTAVVGALLALGTQAADFFAEMGVPVISVEAMPYDLWRPRECPLCAAGQALEDVAATRP
jgi:orotate phosphoribosyltransferase